MHFSTSEPEGAIVAPGVVFDVGGLYSELAKLDDLRKARGKRYGLAAVLVLFVLAKLCGEDRPYGIAQWVCGRAEALIAALGLAWQRVPSHNTYRRILRSAVELEQLQGALTRFLCRNSGQSVLVTIDGKSLRGSLAPGQERPVHLLAAYAPQEGVVLMQVAVDGKENELTVAPRLLGHLDLRGKVVMGDAMFTQRELSVQIIQAGGDYIWLAKDNQRHLTEAIARLFAPQERTPGWGLPRNDFQVARSQGKGHGRLEERILTSSELLNGYLGWPGVAQVFKLERRRTRLKDGTHQTQVVYGLTSLSRHEADAPRLLALVRDYWSIENRLFHCRDTTLHEDATRMSHPVMAQAMALINSLVISIATRHKWTSLPDARRYYNANPQAALACLLRSRG